MAEDQDILEPEVADDQQTPPGNGGQQPAPQGPGPQQPVLKDEDKQRLYKIITNMEKAGEPAETIKAVVKRFQEVNAPTQVATPIDNGIKQTTKSLNQPLGFNGTFTPDLEGERNGLYLNDADYQKQKADFVSRVATDPKGNLLYPEQDAKGQWSNFYTKQPLPDFNPASVEGKILQVPDQYLRATNGKKFISPVYDPKTNAYTFPGVQTPDVPTQQTLPTATVYGKKQGQVDNTTYTGATKTMVDESDKQKGQLRDVLKEHPELAGEIDETLNKYGPEYKESLGTGSGAMSNILEKTIADHYNLNEPLPGNVNPDALNGHLNVLNNFEKNRQTFEAAQQDLQRQSDLLTDRSKRTGQPIEQDDVDRLAQKAADNLRQWNNYTKSVQFSQNYVNQPEVKGYLDEFKKRQQGLALLDELRQRAFPNEVNNAIKQDEYDRKAIEGNLNAWDYTKTALGAAGKGFANIGETAAKILPGAFAPGLSLSDKGNTYVEQLNNRAQQYLSANLPAISPEGLDQMNKKGMSHMINDLSSTVGGFAPYIVPGLAEEGLGTKAATFATALAQGMPEAKQEAEKQGLTGSAYNTFIAARPLVSAAFMTLLPNAKFAKGFDKDVAEAVVNGEFNNSKRALLNLAEKVVTPHPGDIAHLQAMLSGTALGNALTNKITNGLQATQDLQRGISRKEGLPVEMSEMFNPKQTVVMALAGKLMEAVPTLKNSIGDMKTGTDVQGTYNNIRNNLLELAGHNLEGVSKKVNEVVQKDPGNLYAQHLKQTLEDFSHASSRMPSGLVPEQKSALFDIQQKISEKQRQMATADPVYQPHLQKNIDELGKQIPEILKDPQKANDYLATGHKQFAREILNPADVTDANLIKSNREKDLADLKDREDALDPKSSSYGVKKEAIEKERAETEDYYDNRLKNISSPKTKADGKETSPDAPQGRQEIEKPTGGEPSDSGDAGTPSIQQAPWARTLDYGDNKGKDETKEAQDKIKDEILNDESIGGSGEKFSDLLGRVIPGIQKTMAEEPHNTAVVTHSSVIKALQVWEDMGRPDISELKGDKLKEFAQRYVDMKPEAEGKVHTFKGDNGNDIKVIRHGETEDNVASEFREDNTQLTDKGTDQAERAGQNLIKETGGEVPKIISSDLPRTMHTSEIINQKLKDNAISKQTTGEVGIRDEATVREGVGGQNRSEQPTGESEQSGQSIPEEKGEDTGKEGKVGEPPPQEPNPNDLPFGHLDTGISHDAQVARTKADLDVEPPQRGEGITTEESIQRGKDLLKEGADVDKIVSDFKSNNKVSSDDMAVVRARYNELADKTNKAYDKYGKDSDEAKKALNEERQFYNDAVKPMQTEWSKIGMAQQGRVDLDTGSVTSISRAFEERNGVEPTEAQKEEIEKLVQKVKGLEKGIEDLKGKMDDAMKSTGKSTTFTEKTKKAADTFRKLKTKEFTFKDSNGNEVPIQKMGIGWNDLVELGAKAIEKTGEIADGIAAILDKVKDADWYKALSSDDKDRFEKELTDHYTEVADQKTASRIKALEKQLSDLQQGKVKAKGPKRQETEREKELKEEIFQAKVNLGLIRPKATPTPKTKITGPDIATRFAGKTDNNFTTEEAKAVWDYLNKTYLDKDTPFGDALQNTATDLGLNGKQVLKALATPKGGKEITTEMYKKQYERRKALDYAKRFVEAGNEPAAKKFFRSLPSRFFNLKTYGHGTVGNITHAGPNIFRPSVWGSYWPNVIKSFSLAYGKTGNYEKAVSTLVHSPNYVEWKRAGLAVDPHESYDDYQVFGRPVKKTMVGKLGQYLGEAGTKGFTGLKFMRYDMAETFYNRASDSEKADPNLRKEIAKLVNHATGHTEVKVSKTIKAITFAPGLEVSRWQRMIGDPAKATNTLYKLARGKATPAELAAAKIVFAGAAQRLATYSALLAANAGLLSAMGSKQTVNTDDPTKSDWLKFKFGGKTLDMTGGVLGPIRLLSALTKEAYLAAYGTPKELRTKPGDKDAQTLFQQARYKLSPLAGDVADVATGTDAMGNIEPWSNLKPSTGRHKMDWFDYASQQLPIPIAAGIGAVTDAMQERGMSKPQINDILNGALQFTVEGFTGAKLNPDYSLQTGGTGGGAGAGGSYGGHHQHQRQTQHR